MLPFVWGDTALLYRDSLVNGVWVDCSLDLLFGQILLCSEQPVQPYM